MVEDERGNDGFLALAVAILSPKFVPSADKAFGLIYQRNACEHSQQRRQITEDDVASMWRMRQRGMDFDAIGAHFGDLTGPAVRERIRRYKMKIACVGAQAIRN